MAQVRKEQVQLTVVVNGKQVSNTIKDLQKEYKALELQRRNLQIGSEEYKKTAVEAARVKDLIDGTKISVKDVNGGVGQLTGSLVNAAKGFAIAYAADAAIKIGQALFSSAKEIDTYGKKSKIVFGEYVDDVEAIAETTALSLGLTKQEYVKAATDIADLLIPMGFQRDEAKNLSTDLVNLSGALSAWTGGQKNATEVSEILNSALLGEREQLKGLGISISQADVDAQLASKGLGKLTGAAKEQAEAIATLELIQAKSVDAQTAFAGGQDSIAQKSATANAELRQAFETLSASLIPAILTLTELATDAAKALAEFTEETLSADNGLGQMVKGAGAAIGATEGLINTLSGANKESDKAAEKFSFFKFILDRLGDAFVQLLGPAAQVFQIFGQIAKATEAPKKAIDSQTAAQAEALKKERQLLMERAKTAGQAKSAADLATKGLRDGFLKNSAELIDFIRKGNVQAIEGLIAQGQAANEKLDAQQQKANEAARKRAEENRKQIEERQQALLKVRAGLTNALLDLDAASADAIEESNRNLFGPPPADEGATEFAAYLNARRETLANSLATLDDLQKQDALRITQEVAFQAETGVIEVSDVQEVLTQRLNELNNTYLERKKLAYQENGDSLIEIEQDIADAQIQQIQRVAAEQERLDEERRQRTQDALNTTSTFIQAGGDLFTAIGDRQLAQIEQRKEAEVAASGNSAKARENIEKKYAKEVEKIERQQNQRKKAQAIVQAIINTAVAITEALPNPVTATLAGVLGAIQLATIAAQPFAEGGITSTETRKRVLVSEHQATSSRSIRMTNITTGKHINISDPQPMRASTGGPVNKPRLAVIGEAGPEWIAPNWQLKSPTYGPMIGKLEQARVRGYEVGGATAPASISQAAVDAAGSRALITEIQGLRADVRALKLQLNIGEPEADAIGALQSTVNANRRNTSL